MKQTTYRVEIELLTEMLGAVPKDKEVYETYIASKGTDNADELDTVPDGVKGTTGFHTDADGDIFLMDYVIKGFMKEAAKALRRMDKDSLSSKLKAYLQIINTQVHAYPRYIPIDLHGLELDDIQRPLRAQTAQGERTALARSDAAPAGSTLRFELVVLGDNLKAAVIEEWLAFGQYVGLGQWRTSGTGRFRVVRFEALADEAEA
jgi:hypothetical protein